MSRKPRRRNRYWSRRKWRANIVHCVLRHVKVCVCSAVSKCNMSAAAHIPSPKLLLPSFKGDFLFLLALGPKAWLERSFLAS